MYPRSKFQEIMLEIREEMAREADFDVDLFIEMMRSGARREAASGLHALAEPDGDEQPRAARRAGAPRKR